MVGSLVTQVGFVLSHDIYRHSRDLSHRLNLDFDLSKRDLSQLESVYVPLYLGLGVGLFLEGRLKV